MVWEKYGSAWGTIQLRPQAITQTGLSAKLLWENRTLIVAVTGLVFVAWLNLRQAAPLDALSFWLWLAFTVALIAVTAAFAITRKSSSGSIPKAPRAIAYVCNIVSSAWPSNFVHPKSWRWSNVIGIKSMQNHPIGRYDPFSFSNEERRPVDILVPMPPIGGKIWLLDRKGLFVLERCAGTLRTLAVTHAGSGALEAIDGVPDENGHFPDDHMPEPEAPPQDADDSAIAEYIERRKAFDSRNGRPFYQAPSTVMNSWMLDGGFLHGLCIRALSGHSSVSATASIVWLPFRGKPK
jgi:hypothetical protein